MVYPFDVMTGAELSDGAVTPNGFKLDMAKSRYLTIDVQRSIISEGANGEVEDVRFKRPAKDGEEYTEEGIYTFNVKNLYTGENTTKTIYVGDYKYNRSKLLSCSLFSRLGTDSGIVTTVVMEVSDEKDYCNNSCLCTDPRRLFSERKTFKYK